MAEMRGKHFHQIIGQKWDEIESSEDVFVDILSRLPAKSLAELKSVSKHWYRKISTKTFVHHHLSRSRENPLYIVYPLMDQVMKLFLVKPNGRVVSRASFPYLGNLGKLYMISSFDGLVFCINNPSKDEREITGHLEIRICNPATEEALLLPQGTPSSGEDPCIGVAYGPEVNEYKVFRIFSTEFYEDETNCYQCELYSSRTGSWRGIGSVPAMPMRHDHSPFTSNHVFVGKKIYWFVASEDHAQTPGSILSVDMEGNFRIISLPEYSTDRPTEDQINEHSYLVNLQGFLSLIVLHAENMDIWVLGEDGWNLRCVAELLFPDDYGVYDDCVYFVTAWKSKILFIAEDYWGTYDVDHETWRFWRNLRTELCHPVAFIYTGSLLSCSGRPNP